MTPPLPGDPAAVVVAHPDDEALWLSSVLASAARIVFCFGDPFEKPEKAAARRQAVDAFPLSGLLDLQIPESGALRYVDWRHPQPTPTGIAISDPAVRAHYEANYTLLVERLRVALAGMRAVYTHNPWGEYGHPDHIQVYRAVEALQAEFGYTIWFSNYAGRASWPLARMLADRPCWTTRCSVRPDRALARTLMRHYRHYGAWTWTRAHLWPAWETLYEVPPAVDSRPRHALMGEALLDVAGLRWWPPLHRSRRRLE